MPSATLRNGEKRRNRKTTAARKLAARLKQTEMGETPERVAPSRPAEPRENSRHANYKFPQTSRFPNIEIRQNNKGDKTDDTADS